MTLDAHVHLWELGRHLGDWPTAELAPIYRDFRFADLSPRLLRAGIESLILVQTATNTAETDYLLEIAEREPMIGGVVGWIDFEADDALNELTRLSLSPKLVGLRPMIQSIAEPRWILRDKFAPIFKAITAKGLCLDGLVHVSQITELDELARRHPALPIALDHGGKPPIAAAGFDFWARLITRLAENPSVHCKLSGLWTEAGDDRSDPVIGRYVRHLLTAFGPRRLMWGSDWPVLEMAGDYVGWHAQCQSLLSDLATSDQRAIFGGNGRRFYGLD